MRLTEESFEPVADPTARQPQRSRRTTRAQRFAENCTPLPAEPNETLEERVDRLDASLTYLSQCYQDELDVRDEGNLLVDVIGRVLIPFAALSAAISLIYVRLVEWAATHYPDFERAAAIAYFVLLGLTLALLSVAHGFGWPGWVTRGIDAIEGRIRSSVPVRKETLTRNNVVNRWIYLWLVGATLFFIPLTFIALRTGVADEIGLQLVIDTANVCDGSGRVRLFTGSSTCLDILEDKMPTGGQTAPASSVGDDATTALIGPVALADSALDAHIAEIRLDTTTTLGLAVAILVLGMLATIGFWWWRNRRVRDIDLL
jgi:hypothetical protein